MPFGIFRAGDEARTRNLFLGKEMFYQLNYAREQIRLYLIFYYCQLLPSEARRISTCMK